MTGIAHIRADLNCTVLPFRGLALFFLMLIPEIMLCSHAKVQVGALRPQLQDQTYEQAKEVPAAGEVQEFRTGLSTRQIKESAKFTDNSR